MAPIINMLSQTTDQDAYHFLAQEAASQSGDRKPDVAAVIGSDWILPETIKRGTGSLTARSVLGPNAIIVDQTIMPSSWNANDKELSRASQDALRQVVDTIVQAVVHSGSSQVPSSSAPTFVLVHENIAEGFFEAMKGATDGTKHLKRMQESISEHRELVESASPGGLDFLPVFQVSSFDYAIDFIQDEISRGVATYVFSNARFGAYAFQALSSVPYVFVNDLPERFLSEQDTSPTLSIRPWPDAMHLSCFYSHGAIH
jgi:hypothetical protein